jgi:hypothetical protein
VNARLILGGLVLAMSTAAFAQAPTQPAKPEGSREKMRSCAQEPDPAKCEARRKELRENLKSAHEACKDKQGRERGTCMSQQMCAKSADPAACQARAKERMEKRHERHEKVAPKNAPKT